jgi:XTP/dITP diphosphohydrolase
MKLCFATNNKGKLSEIQALLGGEFQVLSLLEIGCNEELPETQPTIEGNSRQKAEYVYNKFHVNCFADDTGLETEALNGEPGVFSARYAGESCSPEDNMQLLLSKLQGKESRNARFVTVITLILDGKEYQFTGEVKGKILKEKTGTEGFGYDPLFQPEGSEKSFAQMTSAEKNSISHRGRAVRQMVNFLKSPS